MHLKKITSILIVLFSFFYVATANSQPTDVNNNFLKFTIVGNGYSDQTIIGFAPGSTPGFDLSYDAYKLMGILAAPQFYSIIECCNLAINIMPDINTNHKVQMGCRFGASTTYTISAEGLYTFGADTLILLHDTQEDIFTELTIDSTYSFTGTADDATERFVVYFNYPAQLDVKVNLAGAWNGIDMNTTINSEGLIPLDQPFNTAPWNYSGTESVASIPNTDIVDWVLLEIRDAVDAPSATSSSVVKQQACFLLNNGNIVSTDGSSLPEFTEMIEKNLFVVIFHRNHIPVLSAQPLLREAGVYPWDFTNNIDKAYGGALAHKDLGSGVYGLFGGDGNTDGNVNMDDKISFWNILAGNKGYINSDYTLDGQINNPDKNEVWLEDNGASSQLP